MAIYTYTIFERPDMPDFYTVKGMIDPKDRPYLQISLHRFSFPEDQGKITQRRLTKQWNEFRGELCDLVNDIVIDKGSEAAPVKTLEEIKSKIKSSYSISCEYIKGNELNKCA